MTMALPFPHLPPEIEAARQTLSAAYKDSLPTRGAWVSRILLYLITLGVGVVVAWVLVSLGVVSPKSSDFWRGALTAISVLAGFMVTTMVFTGKIEAAKNLSATELREVAAKVTHLLLYQFGTLTNHLVCLMALFFTPFVAAAWPRGSTIMASISLALFFVSIIRSMFIPLQIIEIHRFTHAALMRDKRDEAKRESARM
jgi:hypothetical protein